MTNPSPTSICTGTSPVRSRRQWLARSACGVGSAALASLIDPATAAVVGQSSVGGLHHPGSAKRVIVLFMGGGPSQLELFDPKPLAAKMAGEDLPKSILGEQRLTTMTSSQSSLPIAPSIFRFAQHGQCGAAVSELLPRFAEVVDEVTFIKSMHTDAINHDPAMTFLQTGHEQPGRPSAGAWASYALGSESAELPAYVVLHSRWSGALNPQPIFARLWGSGFLPSQHQGVAFRSVGDPVLYLTNPPGVTDPIRRRMLAGLAELNQQRFSATGDSEIETRIRQYELAARMQVSVPELADLSDESVATKKLYGPECEIPGTFASNCLLARRMAERGVRFVQVFHRGWDQHGNLPADIRQQSGDIDQPCAGLIMDLKQRGLLDNTLVIWAGEFGRTIYSQGTITADDYGRDHHPRCFTVWMAGGGVKRGFTLGGTDELGYNIVDRPVHVHDLNATMLHILGISHTRLTYRHQGRDFRLTDVHGKVVREVLA